MNKFITKVVGVTFRNSDRKSRQKIIRENCQVGDRVRLIPDLNNKFDNNAIKVCLLDNRQIGHLNSRFAFIASHKIKNGFEYLSYIKEVDFFYNEYGKKIYFVILCVIEWDKSSTSREDIKKYFSTNKSKDMEEAGLVYPTAKKIQNTSENNSNQQFIDKPCEIIGYCLAYFILFLLFFKFFGIFCILFLAYIVIKTFFKIFN